MKTLNLRTAATCLLLAALLLQATPAPARASSSPSSQKLDVAWDAVKNLPTGDRVRVELKSGRRVTGTLRGVEDERLVLARDGRSEEFARAGVRRVHHLQRRAKKGLFAAIGAGAGAGVGLVVGAVKADPLVDDSEIFYVLGPAVGAGFGALVGALFGRERRRRVLVYESVDR